MKLALTLLILLHLSVTQASGPSCGEQTALAKLTDEQLFGFSLSSLPLSDRESTDFSQTVVEGSCVFKVFYMFGYTDRRGPGWYYPVLVSVDSMDGSVFEASLISPGVDKLQTIKDGSSIFRAMLETCGCSIP